ncbi:unnamed protein product [Arabis nemorensis]|uniref:VQ domain-containing protein n=1 Tax=Arabis nemorensis TaxID=586526 RepID=A0A565AVB1_9BRAS|nr:unnamed protein product [Arabis nemorensis]
MDRLMQNDQLGVNKIGKNIKKSPLHQPSFLNGIEALPQSQVYNISKNDFRSVVQQLTGSPLRESFPQQPPPQNLPKPQNTRLLKIRPAALTPITRPRVLAPVMAQPIHNLAARPPPQPYMHHLPHSSQPMMGHGDQCWLNTVESPVSLYMCYLQSSVVDSGQNGNQVQPSHEYQPRPPPTQSLNHHSPRLNGSASSMPILPTPRFKGRGILPSPTSQYFQQSPTAYRSFPSPRSPYPLLSPGVQYPSPVTPRNFAISSMDQPGILGPGKFPQSRASPGLVLPSSPFRFFPVSSPRWRGY